MERGNRYSIINLSETDSTNEYAKKIAREGANDKTVIIAEYQSAGKGRLGRNFFSENGKGIFMSIILRPDLTPEQAGGLTLVTAVAVHQAILHVCGINTGIKWPNDIVADGKKLCGILTEMSTSFEVNGVKFVVVGIGINVLNEVFDAELSKLATSLYILTGQVFSKEKLIYNVLQCFDTYYEKYLEVRNLSVIRNIYDENLIHTGKVIKAVDGDRVLQGVCKGINGKGHLLVETDEGTEEIISGEISVRGVYGYV